MIEAVRLSDLRPKDFERIVNRNKKNFEACQSVVNQILEDIRSRGDRAIEDHEKLYDKVELKPENFRVKEAEISDAYKKIPRSLMRAIKFLAKNLKEIHRRQLPVNRVLINKEGILVRQVFNPIRSVALYVPGGRATYTSTALMLAIPAKVAGVKRIVACSPPSTDGKINQAILVALDVAGVEEVYRIGGAQAIGALTYGTETVRKVDKIVGPGNIYVTAAKMRVYGDVGIDFPAGPSEIVVYLDETVNPSFASTDIISQAEHDPSSVPILISTSEKAALEVRKRILEMLPTQARRSTIEDSLRNNGAILIAKDEKEAAEFINRFAPEHLEIASDKPKKIISLIENAGLISIGPYTPVAAVDYAVGVNHVLPTGGKAAFHSGLTVYDFIKSVHVVHLNRGGLRRLTKPIQSFSEAEGLVAHWNSVSHRFK